MYGCESWTVKKAEHQRIDAFELWCWRRVLRVPWIARRSNQSILKEISPEYSLERLMLKLKLWYLGHLMGRTASLGKTLMLGKTEGRKRRGNRGWDGWMASLTQWTWVWVNSRSWWWTGKPGLLQSMGSQRVRHEWATELNWSYIFTNVISMSSRLHFFVSIHISACYLFPSDWTRFFNISCCIPLLMDSLGFCMSKNSYFTCVSQI